MSTSAKDLEKRLLESGKALLLPSSVDMLLHLLDKLFICLLEVEQSPPSSIQNALFPLKKALVDERLFKHWNVDVRVSVASCITEVTRINAPHTPYVDDQIMREVLQLIVSSFEHLDDKYSLSYTKRTSILDTVAKCQVSFLMLDPVYDALRIKMFQHFLKSLRDHHPVKVFSDMENVMTHILKESDDISPELLAPILHYVKKNDEVPPISRRLAEKVLINCSNKCEAYLAEAVKSLGVSLDKYSNVVALICEGAFSVLKQNKVEHDKPKKQDDMNGRDGHQQLDNPINSGLDVSTTDEKTGRPVKAVKKESWTEEAKPSAAEEINTSEARLTKESGKKIAFSINAKPTVPRTKKNTSEIKSLKRLEKSTSLGDNKKTIVSSGNSASNSKTEVKQPSEKPLVNTSAKRKHSLDTEKASDDRKYDGTLVGSRIRVWWPLDKRYYKGEVTSYDPSRKRHTVIYEDGDRETLYLKNHNWYRVDESKSSKNKQKAADVCAGEKTGKPMRRLNLLSVTHEEDPAETEIPTHKRARIQSSSLHKSHVEKEKTAAEGKPSCLNQKSSPENINAPKRRLNLSASHGEDPAEAETLTHKRARIQSHTLHKAPGEMEKTAAEAEPSCHIHKYGPQLVDSQTFSITHQLAKVKQSIADAITSVRQFGSEVETKEQSIVDMLTSVRQFRSELETKEQSIVDTLTSFQQFRCDIKTKEDNLVASLHEVDVLGEKISGINKILNS